MNRSSRLATLIRVRFLNTYESCGNRLCGSRLVTDCGGGIARNNKDISWRQPSSYGGATVEVPANCRSGVCTRGSN
eukprot:scaffold30280_cov57-Phaeocystis_antarctica.AAC.4